MTYCHGGAQCAGGVPGVQIATRWEPSKYIHAGGQGPGDGTHGRSILIEDDVVGEAGVVHPGHALASLDGHGAGLERQGTGVSAELDGGIGIGSHGKSQGGHSNTRGLGHLLEAGLGLHHLGGGAGGAHGRGGAHEGRHGCLFVGWREAGMCVNVWIIGGARAGKLGGRDGRDEGLRVLGSFCETSINRARTAICRRLTETQGTFALRNERVEALVGSPAPGGRHQPHGSYRRAPQLPYYTLSCTASLAPLPIRSSCVWIHGLINHVAQIPAWFKEQCGRSSAPNPAHHWQSTALPPIHQGQWPH